MLPYFHLHEHKLTSEKLWLLDRSLCPSIHFLFVCDFTKTTLLKKKKSTWHMQPFDRLGLHSCMFTMTFTYQTWQQHNTLHPFFFLANIIIPSSCAGVLYESCARLTWIFKHICKVLCVFFPTVGICITCAPAISPSFPRALHLFSFALSISLSFHFLSISA